MKHSFTLMEVLISITLFSIIVVFLFQSLNISLKSNDFMITQNNELDDINQIKKVIILDMMNADEDTLQIEKDRNKNTLIYFQSKHTLHDKFNSYICYCIVNGQFVRVESFEQFDLRTLTESSLENIFVDILFKNVKQFDLIKSMKKTNPVYLFFINLKSKTIQINTVINNFS